MHEQVRVRGLDRAGGELDGALVVPRARAHVVLLGRDPEEQHRGHAERGRLGRLVDRRRQGQAIDAGHGLDGRAALEALLDEEREDEVGGVQPRLAHEVAEDRGATQAAQAGLGEGHASRPWYPRAAPRPGTRGCARRRRRPPCPRRGAARRPRPRPAHPWRRRPRPGRAAARPRSIVPPAGSCGRLAARVGLHRRALPGGEAGPLLGGHRVDVVVLPDARDPQVARGAALEAEARLLDDAGRPGVARDDRGLDAVQPGVLEGEGERQAGGPRSRGRGRRWPRRPSSRASRSATRRGRRWPARSARRGGRRARHRGSRRRRRSRPPRPGRRGRARAPGRRA